MGKVNNKQSILVPILVVGLLIISFVAGSLWQKVKTLEKEKTTTGATTSGTAAPEQVSKLSVDNLKKYAKELKLDTKKFDNCLDKDEKKEIVSSEQKEGEAIGVAGTPAFFINGYLVSGAIPFEMFKVILDYELSTGFASGKTYPEEVKKLIDQGVINTEKKEVKIGNSPVLGPANAKITIVEYSDFECPFCGRVAPTIKQILETYPNDVKLVFKQYPLPFHASAQKAAEASLCAFDQGKFWEYHDKLFETSTN